MIGKINRSQPRVYGYLADKYHHKSDGSAEKGRDTGIRALWKAPQDMEKTKIFYLEDKRITRTIENTELWFGYISLYSILYILIIVHFLMLLNFNKK